MSFNLYNKIAQIDGGSLSGIPGGPVGGADTMARVISAAIALMTVIGAIYFIFVLVTGAIGIIGSGGDKGGWEEGRKKITTGVIGLVVLISAMFIIEVVSLIFGLPNILSNFSGIISGLRV